MSVKEQYANQKLAYEQNYNSSYDYSVYGLAFVFIDEEELEDLDSFLSENNFININNYPGLGGNIH